jgi:hypothetical protein
MSLSATHWRERLGVPPSNIRSAARIMIRGVVGGGTNRYIITSAHHAQKIRPTTTLNRCTHGRLRRFDDINSDSNRTSLPEYCSTQSKRMPTTESPTYSSSGGAISPRYSCSLFRSVRMLIPSNFAASVRLSPVARSVSKISALSISCTVVPERIRNAAFSA